MEKHIGMITCYDEAGTEREIETPDLNSYLRSIGVIKREKLKNELFSRLQGSANRSYWFMNYNYRDFTEADLTREYYMPVCGVKEQPEGRIIKYVQWVTFPENALNGFGFNDSVFGVDYITRQESVYKKQDDLMKIISSRQFPVGKGVDSRQIDTVCRILHAIWDTQTFDTMARIVILLDDPENESMELLRQVYLLIPCCLRLQMGFMTNVSAADLTQIGDKGRMPIYIMTASPSEWENISQYSYSFPVYPVDATKLDSYGFSEDKLTQIKRLAKDMDPQTAVRFDYIEKKILESHQTNAPSFRYYGEILENVYSGEYFWWYKERIDSVEELESLYKDQAGLMSNADYHREALRQFSTTIYPASDIAGNIVEIVNNEKYPNRKRLLAFLADEMEMKKQIESIEDLRGQLLSEKKHSLENLEDRLRTQFNLEIANRENELNSKISQLEADHAVEVEELNNKHEHELNSKKLEYQNSIQTINNKNRQLEDQLNEKGKEIQDLTKDLEKSNRDARDLKEEKKKLQNENRNLSSRIQNLEKDLERVDDPSGNYKSLRKVEKDYKRLTFIACIVSGLLFLFVVSTVMLSRQKGKLIKERDDYVAQLEELNNQEPEPAIDSGVNNNEAGSVGLESNDAGNTVSFEETSQAETKESNINESEKPVQEQVDPSDSRENEQEMSDANNGEEKKKDEEGENKKETAWETNDAIEILKMMNDNILQFKGIDDKGKGEKDLFFHVKFSAHKDVEDVEGFGDKRDKYIGTYVDGTSADKGEQEKQIYKWREFTGMEGDKGYFGPYLENGQYYYLHIAFADSKDGKVNFSSTELGDRKYIGFYIDIIQGNSHEPSDYGEWKEIPSK